MTRLRVAVWALFVTLAVVNASYAAVMYAMDMALSAVLSAITAILALVAAVVLHLVAKAYQAELENLVALNESLMRMTNAIEERRTRGSGPDAITDL